MILEGYGFNVISVYEVEQAVRVVNESPNVDLILMDINLGNRSIK